MMTPKQKRKQNTRKNVPFTAAEIDGLLPEKEEYRLSDGHQLYLVVKPTGLKVWKLHYRFNGRRRRIRIGVYGKGEGKVGLAEARLKAAELLQQIRAGIDPLGTMENDADEEPKKGTTFRDVYEDWLHVHRPRADGRGWSTGHAYRCRRLGEKYLYGKLGDREPKTISQSEIVDLLRPVWDEKPESGEKLLSCLRLAFRHGKALGLLDVNPCADIRFAMPPLPSPAHFAAVTTPEDAGRLMRAIYAYPHTRTIRAAMLFHAWTAGRSAEVRMATWDEINMDEALWTIPAKRMKARREHRVPLPRQAVDMLRGLRSASSPSDGGYVFPSLRTKVRPISENSVLAALRGMGYDKGRMTTHGFRSMFSTLANSSGRWASDLIEAQLAHVSGDAVRDAYNRTDYLDRRREMMQWWADWLDDLRAQADAEAAAASAPPKPEGPER